MTIRLLAGDCRDVLPTLSAESVQCVVTATNALGSTDAPQSNAIAIA